MMSYKANGKQCDNASNSSDTSQGSSNSWSLGPTKGQYVNIILERAISDMLYQIETCCVNSLVIASVRTIVSAINYSAFDPYPIRLSKLNALSVTLCNLSVLPDCVESLKCLVVMRLANSTYYFDDFEVDSERTSFAVCGDELINNAFVCTYTFDDFYSGVIRLHCCWCEVYHFWRFDLSFRQLRSVLCGDASFDKTCNLLLEIPRAQALFEFNAFSANPDAIAKSVVAALTTMFDSEFAKTAVDASKLMGLVLQFVSIVKDPNVWAISSFLYQIMLNCKVSVTLMSTALKFLDQYLESCVNWFIPRAQSGVDDFANIGAVVVTLMSVIGLSALPSKSYVMDAIKIAGFLGRGCSGLKMSVDFITGVVIQLMDWCYIRLFGVPRTTELYNKLEGDVLEFMRTVNSIAAIDSSVSMRDNAELRDKIRECRTEAHALQVKLTDMKIDTRGLGYFNTFVNRIDKIAEKADIHCIVGDGPRPEPVVIQYFGATGVGKSHVPYFMAADLVSAMGYSERPVNYMYYRSVEQEFWDGYTAKKKIVVYDDFGQRKDTSTNPNPEFMELIRSGNIAAWPLHMASLTEKANTYFRSKAIILTSNEVNYKLESLTHSEAYVRRVDLRFEVSIDPQYAMSDGSLDEAKVKAKFGDECSEEVYRFVPYIVSKKGIYDSFDPVQVRDASNNLVNKSLTFDEMSEMVIAKFKIKQQHGEARLRAIDARMRKVEAARAQVLLSSAEEFLSSFWHRGGCIDSYYTVDASLIEKLIPIAMKCPNIFAFIDTVLKERIPLNFTKVKQDDLAQEGFKTLTSFVRDTAQEDVNTVLSSMKTYMSSILETQWFKGIALVFGLVASVTVLKRLYTWFKRMPDAEGFASGDQVTRKLGCVRVEGHQSGDQATKKLSAVRVEGHSGIKGTIEDSNESSCVRVEGVNLNPKSSIKSQTIAQAYIDSNANEVIQNVLACNLYRVGGDGGYVANIMFVVGRIALCNWHVFDFLSQYDNITIRNPYIEKGYHVAIKDIVVYKMTTSSGEFKDAVLLEFPKFIVTHRSMLKQFVRSQDLSGFKSTPGLLVGICSAARDKLISRVEPLDKIIAYDNLKYKFMGSDGVDRDLFCRHGYRYSSQTSAGDCGSVLMINNTSIVRKVCGIHVAGVIGGGYAVSITHEDLVRALSLVPFSSRIGFELHDTVNCEVRSEHALVGNFPILGKNSVMGSCPSKTDIYPSPIHGMVAPVKCAPAVLRPIEVDGQMVDPLLKGIEKCGDITPTIDNDLLKMACDDLMPVLLKGAEPCHQRVLTYAESITGTNDVFMCPINRRSSAGYGWSANTGGKVGKTKWLGEDEYDLDNVELKAAVLKREDMALQGIRAPHLWVDTLKAERRPIEKVKQGKIRVFSVGQQDYIVLCRKYFLGFCAHIMHHRIDNEIAVGINPYSYEWTYLANRQQSVGKKCLAADFSNYDGSLLKQILHCVFDIYIEFMLMNKDDIGMDWEDFIKIATVIFDEMVSSIHLCKDIVYEWTHSNPSGNPLTTIINCIYALILLRICYIIIFGTVEGFKENVKLIQYGDDMHANISDKIIDKFNQHSLTIVMADLGMTFTDELKATDPPAFRMIEETSFLKRKFILRDGRYDAPLSLDTILEMISWVRGTLDIDELTVSNVETACRELSLHSEDVFDKYVAKIKKVCYGVGLFPTIHSYHNYRMMLFLGQVGVSRVVVVNHDGFTENDSE